jgi:hypothetical protein
MNGAIASGCSFGQSMVNQGPKYDGQVRKARRPNQVLSKKTGIIRPDKRKKAKYL